MAAMIIITLFCEKKVSFLTPDGISITLNKADMYEEHNETYISSSLWNLSSGSGVYLKKYSRKSLFCMLLLMSGDIETCPGPNHCIEEMDRICKQSGMKLFHQNIRGIFSNFNGLCELFQSNPNIDILTLSETHLNDADFNGNQGLYNIQGYEFVCRNRKVGKGGGVAFYIKNDIRWKRRYDIESDNIESIWLEIFINKSKSFLISSIYKPPEGSKYLLKDFDESFDKMLSNVTSTKMEVILMGDCNVNFFKGANKCNFKSTLSLYGFEQLVKRATRITNESSTLIDIIATNKPSVLKSTDVILIPH